MVSFHFVDSHGTGWMILPGLPADYPDAGEEDEFLPGLSFRASTGEVRVLPRAAVPRRASADIVVPALGTRSRVRALETGDWEALLRHALVWPPA